MSTKTILDEARQRVEELQCDPLEEGTLAYALEELVALLEGVLGTYEIILKKRGEDASKIDNHR